MNHMYIYTLGSCSYSISKRWRGIDQAAMFLIKLETRDKREENRRGGQTKDRRTERKTYEKKTPRCKINCDASFS